MTDFLSVYMTAGSREEAETIAHALVDDRLAACVNIIPEVASVYRWKGKVERADEYVLIAKTIGSQFGALEKRVRAMHSYECPCIVATTIDAGSDDFLAWVCEQTK